ncbi:hypothetical protein LCGC14_3076620 [marine sediment metagenome]|uniref:Uncharacterized protein n=1 Tax=marine sediment metagenome TaxID=412755 RepID=A0A0F8YM16_9ZZZZ
MRTDKEIMRLPNALREVFEELEKIHFELLTYDEGVQLDIIEWYQSQDEEGVKHLRILSDRDTLASFQARGVEVKE